MGLRCRQSHEELARHVSSVSPRRHELSSSPRQGLDSRGSPTAFAQSLASIGGASPTTTALDPTTRPTTTTRVQREASAGARPGASSSPKRGVLAEFSSIVAEQHWFYGCQGAGRADATCRPCEQLDECTEGAAGDQLHAGPLGVGPLFDERPWSLSRDGGAAPWNDAEEDLSIVSIPFHEFSAPGPLGLVVAPDPSGDHAVVIESIAPGGVAASWNAKHVGAEIRVKDRIVSVNGRAGLRAADLEAALQAPAGVRCVVLQRALRAFPGAITGRRVSWKDDLEQRADADGSRLSDFGSPRSSAGPRRQPGGTPPARHRGATTTTIGPPPLRSSEAGAGGGFLELLLGCGQPSPVARWQVPQKQPISPPSRGEAWRQSVLRN